MNDDARVEEIRKAFPALHQLREGRPPVYLDNACTTLVPWPVIDAMNRYYTRYPACGGARSSHWFADEVTRRIEGDPLQGVKGSRQVIQQFINARSETEIIFTLNTSHAINIVALSFNFQPGDVVLVSEMEHNSNLIPWLRLQKKGLIQVETLAFGPDFTFDLDAFRRKFAQHRIRLVSMALTSNLTGHSIPAAEIIRTAHAQGARVMLDAAQWAPHAPIDVQTLDVDFLAFSLHKMCGPKGMGILYGKRDLLGASASRGETDRCMDEPAILGGGSVSDATYGDYTLLDPPERFEVGVQNHAGQIASAVAVQYLQGIGLPFISAHENRLNRFLSQQLMDRYGDSGWFRILGPTDAGRRAGILTFEVKRPNAVGIAEELDRGANIMIRGGAFCNHAYLNKRFGPKWAFPRMPDEHRMTYRVSLYFYNTIDECQIFLEALRHIFEERSYV
jgi:cysteine desulfurase/selenocysteine lyase